MQRIWVELKGQQLLPTNALEIKQPIMEIMELQKNLVVLYADSPLPAVVDLGTQAILMICTG